MAPLSAAERAKRYRLKNKQRVREMEALRKRHMRVTMKVTNPNNNQERLLKQRLYKQEYRKKKAISITDNSPSTSSSTETPVDFAHRSTKIRSIKKVEKALPKSPTKQKAVVRSLAQKFQLKILPLNEPPKRGRKKNELDEQESDWLEEFFNRSDVTYTTPGKKDQIYIGKVDGEKVFKQKKYFLWTLNELLDIVNGGSIASNTEDFLDAFGRKLSFRQLYDNVKQHKELVYNKNTPHATCLCEICENAVYFMKAVNQCLPKESALPTNPHDIMERFSCDSANMTCMTSDCSDCTNQDQFEEILSEGEFDADTFIYTEWKKVDEKIQKAASSVNTEEIIILLGSHVKTLKEHIRVKRIQYAKFHALKANLHDDEILIQVDYSESYANQEQGQIQSAYFGQQTFSIFTACCYLRFDGQIINENVTITSEASDHSRIAALSCWLRIVSFIQEKYTHLPESLILHMWSDGCAGQFR